MPSIEEFYPLDLKGGFLQDGTERRSPENFWKRVRGKQRGPQNISGGSNP